MQGRFAEAAESYQKAYEVFEQLNEDPRMASVLHGLGNALLHADRIRAGPRLLHEGRRRSCSGRRTSSGSRARSRPSRWCTRSWATTRRPSTRGARAWRWPKPRGDLAGTAKAWTGIGDLYRLQGDLARALEHQIRGLEIWIRLKNAGETATAHFAIGQLHALQRNYPRALESYQKALDLDLSLTDDPKRSEAGQARDLGGMGGAHFAQGQPDVALPEYERSLALREKTGDDVGVMWTLVHIGVLHGSQRRFEEAVQGVRTRPRDRRVEAGSERGLDRPRAPGASWSSSRRQLDAALASAARAADIATSIEHFDTVAYARLAAGRAHQKAGRAAEARVAFEEAVAAFAKVPPGPAAETFFDNRQAPYLAMVDLLASQGSFAEAFQWAERGRQQALAELLGTDGAAVVKGLTAEERDLERAIAKDLRTLAVKIRRERGRQKPDPARLAALQADQAARQADRDALRRRLYEAHPALRAMRAQAEPASPEAASILGGARRRPRLVRRRRGADVGVRDRARTPRPTAWKVEKAAAIDVKSADLSQQVRRFREAIARKEDAALVLGGELYTLLLEPVAPVLAKKTRLVVVPDAFLWSLPFESLPNAAGRFLVEDAAVAYAPSLTALVAMDAARPRAATPPTLVAFGQPVLGKAAEERLALVRPPAPATPPPPADREVQNAAAVFGPARSKTYVGDAARADKLAAGVAPGSIIHLAVPLVLAEGGAALLTAGVHADRRGGRRHGPHRGGVADVVEPARRGRGGLARRVRADIGRGRRAHRAGLVASTSAGTPTLVVNRWLGAPTDPERRGPVPPRARRRAGGRRRPAARVGIAAEGDEGDSRSAGDAAPVLLGRLHGDRKVGRAHSATSTCDGSVRSSTRPSHVSASTASPSRIPANTTAAGSAPGQPTSR